MRLYGSLQHLILLVWRGLFPNARLGLALELAHIVLSRGGPIDFEMQSTISKLLITLCRDQTK
jgi:hypothetical protein